MFFSRKARRKGVNVDRKHALCKHVLIFTGEVLITNWKPIAVETICHQEDKTKTVGEILFQINTVPTLKITLKPKLPSLNLKELDQREHALSLLFQQYYRDLKLKAATEVTEQFVQITKPIFHILISRPQMRIHHVN